MATKDTIRATGYFLSLMLAIFPSLSFGDCPITAATDDAVPEAPAPMGKFRWYGDKSLAALIPSASKWRGKGPDKNYQGKFWWWSDSFDMRAEHWPALEVTATLMGNPAITATASRGAVSKKESWPAMMVLMRFPRPGCWEVTGEYKGMRREMIMEVGE